MTRKTLKTALRKISVKLRHVNIKKQSRNKILLHQQKAGNVLDSLTMCQVFTRGSYLNKNVKPASSCDVFCHICEKF